MEESTIAAYAALAIAIFAMFIAIAQVLQQYFVTGQLIRLCDSVVFGGLPGEGGRFWQMSQFRFRVVYKIPQIGLDPSIWPSSVAPSFEQGNAMFPVLANDRHGETVGEASWAAFYKLVFASCYDSIGHTFVTGDADRCPADLPTIPMQMSLRDCIVMGLMSGMECTAASFDRGAVSMKGSAGTITSAQHPVLGPTVHFSSRPSVEKHTIAHHGKITRAWLWRAMGNCTVAGHQYNLRSRAAAYRSTKRKMKRGEHVGRDDLPVELRNSRHPQDGPWQLVGYELAPAPGADLIQPALDDMDQPELHRLVKSDDIVEQKLRAEADNKTARPTWTRMSLRFVELEVLDKFGLKYDMDPDDPTMVIINRFLTPPECKRVWKYTLWYRRRHGKPARFRDSSESGGDASVNTATDRSGRGSIRRRPVASIRSNAEASQHSKEAKGQPESIVEVVDGDEPEIVAEAVDDDEPEIVAEVADDDEPGSGVEARDLEEQEIQSLAGKNSTKMDMQLQGSDSGSKSNSYNADSDNSGSGITESLRSQGVRDDAHKRVRHNLSKEKTPDSDDGNITWFWFAQTDIVPGFWATPWRNYNDLHQQLCVPAIAALLAGIKRLWHPDGLRYLRADLEHPAISDTAAWMRAGHMSYPAYAHGTDAGVVCAGVFAAVPSEKSTCGFADPIPAIDLLGSHAHQVDKVLSKSQVACEFRLVELMRLDAWLSMVGRRDEIRRGASNLLDKTPLLVEDLITEFETRLLDAALVDKQAQPQMYEVIGAQMVNSLHLSFYGKAESLYLLVASLRAVKVGQAALAGSDTRMLLEVFDKDVQVYMI